MKEKLIQFKKIRDKFEQELKSYCKDKSISIDERWQIFVDSGMGNISFGITECDSIHTILSVKPCYFERYSTIYYTDILVVLEDPEEYEYFGLKDGWQNELKEHALKNYEAGWIHDW